MGVAPSYFVAARQRGNQTCQFQYIKPTNVTSYWQLRNTWTPLLVLVYLVAFGGAVNAQTLDDQRCFTPRPGVFKMWSAIEDRIVGCTAVIRAGRETPANLSEAFSLRGFAYLYRGQLYALREDFEHAKQDYDQAIQDYDQAIRLNPNHANHFNSRGLAYFAKGQFDRAIQDYDQAIQLDPQSARPFFNRGVAKRAKGDSTGGDDDIAKALQLDPNLNAANSWFAVTLQHFHDESLFRAVLELAVLVYTLFKLLGMAGLYNWYQVRQFVKRSNFRRWVGTPFRSRFASNAAVAAHAQTLDTEHLLWAIKLSDRLPRS